MKISWSKKTNIWKRWWSSGARSLSLSWPWGRRKIASQLSWGSHWLTVCSLQVRLQLMGQISQPIYQRWCHRSLQSHQTLSSWRKTYYRHRQQISTQRAQKVASTSIKEIPTLLRMRLISVQKYFHNRLCSRSKNFIAREPTRISVANKRPLYRWSIHVNSKKEYSPKNL